ncbi:AhpD-like protein [Hyaloscypha variabilis]
MPALATYRPDIYAHIAPLADLLLHQPHPDSTLAPADRELIATYVSSLNQCAYCTAAHGAVAAAHLCVSPREVEGLLGQSNSNDEEGEVKNEGGVNLTPKMRALLKIAAAVTVSGKNVSTELVESASDMDVHDTVLIAAAFCMFNRYVDGLGTEKR